MKDIEKVPKKSRKAPKTLEKLQNPDLTLGKKATKRSTKQEKHPEEATKTMKSDKNVGRSNKHS